MIKNTTQFSNEILFESDLNIIVGDSDSGKSQLCDFMSAASFRQKFRNLNYEQIEHDWIYQKLFENIENTTKNYDIIFLNSIILTVLGTDSNNINLVIDKIKDSCIKNNCTIFITVNTMSSTKNQYHILNWLANEPTTANLILSRKADNILTIEKIERSHLPWLLRIFKWIFRFDVPNTSIKFIKSKFSNENLKLYLYYDADDRMYYDIDRRNPFLRLFYEF